MRRRAQPREGEGPASGEQRLQLERVIKQVESEIERMKNLSISTSGGSSTELVALLAAMPPKLPEDAGRRVCHYLLQLEAGSCSTDRLLALYGIQRVLVDANSRRPTDARKAASASAVASAAPTNHTASPSPPLPPPQQQGSPPMPPLLPIRGRPLDTWPSLRQAHSERPAAAQPAAAAEPERLRVPWDPDSRGAAASRRAPASSAGPAPDAGGSTGASEDPSLAAAPEPAPQSDNLWACGQHGQSSSMRGRPVTRFHARKPGLQPTEAQPQQQLGMPPAWTMPPWVPSSSQDAAAAEPALPSGSNGNRPCTSDPVAPLQPEPAEPLGKSLPRAAAPQDSCTIGGVAGSSNDNGHGPQAPQAGPDDVSSSGNSSSDPGPRPQPPPAAAEFLEHRSIGASSSDSCTTAQQESLQHLSVSASSSDSCTTAPQGFPQHLSVGASSSKSSRQTRPMPEAALAVPWEDTDVTMNGSSPVSQPQQPLPAVAAASSCWTWSDLQDVEPEPVAADLQALMQRPRSDEGERLLPFVLDFETFSVGDKRALEVGCTSASCATQGDVWTSLVCMRDQDDIPASSREFHRTQTGLSKERCQAEGALPSQAYQSFLRIVAEGCSEHGGATPVLVAHNGVRFDFPILVDSWHALHPYCPWPRHWRWLDTLEVLRGSAGRPRPFDGAIRMACGQGGTAVLTNQGSHVKHSLPALNAMLQLNPDAQEHHAGDDIFTLLRLLQWMARSQNETLEEFVSSRSIQERNRSQADGARASASQQLGGRSSARRAGRVGSPSAASRGGGSGGSGVATAVPWSLDDEADATIYQSVGQWIRTQYRRAEQRCASSLRAEAGDAADTPCQEGEEGSWSRHDPLAVLEAAAAEQGRDPDATTSSQPAAGSVPGLRHPALAFLGTSLLNLKNVKGLRLGRHNRESLMAAGYSTVLRLLLMLPQRFCRRFTNSFFDFQEPAGIVHLEGKVISSEFRHVSSGKGCLRVCVAADVLDPQGQRHTVEVRQVSFMAGRGVHQLKRVMSELNIGSQVVVHGEVLQDNRLEYTMRKQQPGGILSRRAYLMSKDVEASQERELRLQSMEESQLQPVYGQVCGLEGPKLEKLVRVLLLALQDTVQQQQGRPEGDREPLAAFFTEEQEQQQLMPLWDALLAVHYPSSEEHLARAVRRIQTQELALLQLLQLVVRYNRMDTTTSDSAASDQDEQHTVRLSGTCLMQMGRAALPFQLTSCQARVLDEILEDMRGPRPMWRLLQGDVGCGKTPVAFLSALAVIGSGWGAALLAPTEVLAEQHMSRMQQLVEQLPEDRRPRVAYLSGALKAKQARLVRSQLEAGEVDLAIGTHALLYDLFIPRLGLVIVDEQHRFGVKQRNKLLSITSPKPHMLSMTATPIPRSAALMHLGAMTHSAITSLPPGRLPVQTEILLDNDCTLKQVVERIREEAGSGGRVFVVCPIIGDSESEMYSEVKSVERAYEELLQEPDIAPLCGLLHGRLAEPERRVVLDAFRSGSKPVLVSTTVVEVGVDVPEASLIVVQHAERFGLAQLHQLRGRVGRSTRASACILVVKKEDSAARLHVLAQSNNGFDVARADLLQRGAGELMGRRQAGLDKSGLLMLADSVRERSQDVEAARARAARLLAASPASALPDDILDLLAAHGVSRDELSSDRLLMDD